MLSVALMTLILADAASVLTIVYWTCMVVGGGLLVFSAMGGDGSDADVDVDVDVGGGFDMHADFDAHAGDFDAHVDAADAVHGGAAWLATWFSLRFVVFFVAVFGTLGVVLTHLTSVGPSMTLLLSGVGGAAVGQGVHQLFRVIRKTSGDSTPQISDYVNRLGRVTIQIVDPDKGEVALQVRGTQRYVPAIVAGADGRFSVGDEVVVVAYRAGVAQVISKAEFERRTRRS